MNARKANWTSAGIRTWLKNILCVCSPALFSRYLFLRISGRRLNLRNPAGLNEKITWLKLKPYAKSPLVGLCADKLEVRRYVTAMGCADILNELYGVWERADEIKEDELPDAFVLKCNHGCGYNCICTDKASFDFPEAKRKLTQWLAADYWKIYAELQYRRIPRRIICEKYLSEQGHVPSDYKIYCFNGRPRYILTCEERETGKPRFFFFDTEWNFCPITHDGQKAPAGFSLPRPKSFSKMLEYAERLSAPFPFVRVDLYEIDGETVFGELTFTPSGGLDTARLPESDQRFGDMLLLEKKAVDGDGEIYRRCMEMPAPRPAARG